MSRLLLDGFLWAFSAASAEMLYSESMGATEAYLEVSNMPETKKRGTQDDLELLKVIIEQNAHLKERVLDLIRNQRSQESLSLLEMTKNEAKGVDLSEFKRTEKK